MPNTGQILLNGYSYNGDFHPTNELNTLADILSICVNSTGSSANGTPCGQLFAATTPAGGTTPADTVGAALSIALHPAGNVSAIYNLQPAAAPFQPTLTSAPADWAVGVSTGSTDQVGYIANAALDGLGTYWTAGYRSSYGATSSYTAYIHGVGVNTQTITPTSAYPYAIALDQNENIWTSERAVYSPTGSEKPCVSACGPYPRPGSSLQLSVAIDASGNFWTLDSDGSLAEYTSAGVFISPAAGYTGLGLDGGSTYIPRMAFDGNGNLWVANPSQNTLVKLNVSGSAPVISKTISGIAASPEAIALDHTGAVWVLSQSSGSVPMLAKYNADGSVAIAPFTSSCLQAPSLTVDGGNNVWVGSCEYSPAGVANGAAPLGSGFAHAPLGYFPAVDASGTLWVFGTAYHYNGVTQLFGVAVPTGASLADALRNGTLAARP